MEKKLYGTILLFVLLFTHKIMIQCEARSCYARSKQYHGACYFRNHINNCRTMCKDEAFTTGKCVHGSCLCSVKCETSGDPNVHPPPSNEKEGGDEDSEGGD
ncbi:defensin-like protein [Striga asiatica]|uniref:Defensin-like protein n=1 Tax=Striga asiatica TaxID=4170 RepID=A0A5A7QNN5_STRAF|nr:defensin-like protein [Striga asiatica]